jgi:flagellar basal-body rod modification protein FlgD
MLVQAPVSSQGEQLPGTGSNSGGGMNDVGFDTFLKLLTAQLQNQDPLNPAEGTEFTGQIAQFSSLEQQLASNKHLEDLANQADTDVQVLAVSYIGKEAMAEGNALYMAEDGQTLDFAYSLEKPSQVVTVEIVNAQTKEVVKSYQESGKPGDHALQWDGKLEDGENAPAGTYALKVSAVTEGGGSAGIKTYTYAEVRAVAGNGKSAEIQLADGRLTNIGDILTVRMSAADAS